MNKQIVGLPTRFAGAWLSFGVLAVLAGIGCSSGSTKPEPTTSTDKVHPPAEPWGRFSGTPKVELLDNGRELRLLEDFAYVDQNGKSWAAPKDSVVNGASIPRAFWSIIGGPLEGQYRNASIIHDVGCERMAESWQGVHLAFYHACRCGGVGESKAKLMYAAVYHFGPRWTQKVVNVTRQSIDPDGSKKEMVVRRHVGERVAVPAPTPTEEAELKAYIDKNPEASLEDLQALFPARPR